MTAAAAEPRRGSLEYWAREAPARAALVEDGRTLSWSAWNDAANRVAEVLYARARIGPDERVAVCMKNRIEWFVVQAAAAKLGARLVPISYRLTPAEIHYIVADAGARAFAFDAEDVDAMARVWTNRPPADKESAVRVVLSVMETGRSGVLSFAEASRLGHGAERVAASSAASIVYTSGTTGRPRGVVLARTSSAKVAPRPEASAATETREPAKNLLGAPLNHAAGQASARATHQAGGTVYVMPRFDAEEALRIISRERITTTFLVPTMLNRIVSLPPSVRAHHDVSSIRVITTGASPCPQALKERVIDYFGDHCLYESYGSTEVGLVSRMRPEDHLKKPGSCGKLLPNVQIRVIGADGTEVAPGGTGEICVRTPVMIERYLNGGAPAELVDGFFATGDVGRMDEDGYLFILDRKKDMIIAGGVNIYPAEIERALSLHPDVFDVAVFGVPHPEWGEAVKAVVECVPGRPLTEASLLEFVSHELASYKRPRSIDFVGELPRNAAGKVLKSELRAPYWQGTGKAI